jgi:hypothetical protein
MEFQYSQSKSEINLKKHGIDFEEAQKLWLDQETIIIPARNEGETRWMVIGQIAQSHWTAIITVRGESIRIISVRRSRLIERIWYESGRI